MTDTDNPSVALLDACQRNDLDGVRQHLATAATSAINQALGSFAYRGHLAGVELLWSRAAPQAHASSFHRTAGQGHVHCVRFFSDQLQANTQEHDWALVSATMARKVDCIPLLLPRCNLDHVVQLLLGDEIDEIDLLAAYLTEEHMQQAAATLLRAELPHIRTRLAARHQASALDTATPPASTDRPAPRF